MAHGVVVSCCDSFPVSGPLCPIVSFHRVDIVMLHRLLTLIAVSWQID